MPFAAIKKKKSTKGNNPGSPRPGTATTTISFWSSLCTSVSIRNPRMLRIFFLMERQSIHCKIHPCVALVGVYTEWCSHRHYFQNVVTPPPKRNQDSSAVTQSPARQLCGAVASSWPPCAHLCPLSPKAARGSSYIKPESDHTQHALRTPHGSTSQLHALLRIPQPPVQLDLCYLRPQLHPPPSRPRLQPHIKPGLATGPLHWLFLPPRTCS